MNGGVLWSRDDRSRDGEFFFFSVCVISEVLGCVIHGRKRLRVGGCESVLLGKDGDLTRKDLVVDRAYRVKTYVKDPWV